MKQENTEFQIPITRPAMSESPGSGNGQIAETHVPGQIGPPSLEDLLAARHLQDDADQPASGGKSGDTEPSGPEPGCSESGGEGSGGGDSGKKPGGCRHYVPTVN